MPSNYFSDLPVSPDNLEAWLRFAVERMPGVFWTTDEQLRFLSGYGLGLAALGLRPNQLRGVSLYDYFQTHDESFPAIQAHREALAGRRFAYEQDWLGRTFAAIVGPLRREDGSIVGCVGIALDISERKQRETELEKRWTQLGELVEHVPAMLYQTSGKADGSTVEVPWISPRAAEFLGATPEEIIRDPMLMLDAVHPEDRARYYETALKAMQTGSLFDFAFRSLTRDGRTLWLRAKSKPVLSPDGKITFHGVALEVGDYQQREEELRQSKERISSFLHSRLRDLTQSNERLEREIRERRQVEERLGKQSHLLDVILSNMPVLAFRINSRLELIDVHGAGGARLGPGDTYVAVLDAAIKTPHVRDAASEALGGGSTRFLLEGRHAGQAWAFDTFLTFDDAAGPGAVGFAIDVSEQQEAMQQLQESEERWHALADTSSDAVLIIDREGIIRYINRAQEGVGAQQVLGTRAADWVPDHCQAELEERLRRVLETGATDAYEMEGWGPGGSQAWYATHIGPYCQEGKISGVVMFVTDVTQRKRDEQARIATEMRYHTLMDAANDAILIIDGGSGRILEANSMALKLTGRTAEDIVQYEHQQLYAPPHVQRVAQLFREYAEQGHGLITDVEILDARERGVPVEVSLRWLQIDGRRLAIGIVRDVTERKRAEQALRSEERLLRELLNLHERERRLIAYDIHDGFVQDVVGAHLAIEGITAQLEAGQSVPTEHFAALRKLLRQAIDEGRRMISELRPMIIDERGIIDAINYLISEHQLQGGPDIEFTHNVHFQRLSPLLEGTMFRIVQEALNNVQRHSQASRAKVELAQQEGRVRLVIRDQGVGFDPASVPADRFGLRGMKERARLFGGWTVIHSQPGQGTEVAVELPIDMHMAEGEGTP